MVQVIALISLEQDIYTLKKSTFKLLFLVLQLVTNRGLSVPGRTNQYLQGPQLEYWDPDGLAMITKKAKPQSVTKIINYGARN